MGWRAGEGGPVMADDTRTPRLTDEQLLQSLSAAFERSGSLARADDAHTALLANANEFYVYG